jgi:hypothetical protein
LKNAGAFYYPGCAVKRGACHSLRFDRFTVESAY